MIRRNAEMEARLIDDLLDLTRIARGKLSLNMQPVDVHDVLREAIATVKADADRKQLHLELDLRADRRVIVGDTVRLEQVFWNVLENAVKFTPDGGAITVKTFTENDTLLIKVTDTGIGMNEGELRRVFNAFSQGDHAESGSHRFGGLGLGLTISRMLIELHSGSISAASAGKGRGATFSIRLPVARTAKKLVPPAAESSAAVSPPTSVPTTGNQSPCILLVEDHEPTRAVLTQLLARRHYEVLTTSSLAEARSCASKDNGHFNLVISDIGLPDGSGYDLMDELRERYGLKGIALTGYGMEQDIVRGRHAGFVTHLTKPVRIESLDNALAESLNGK